MPSGVIVSRSTNPFDKKLQVLEVMMYNHFNDHSTCVVQACNYHMRTLCHIRLLIFKDNANNIACSVVGCRLDYCNAIVYGIIEANLNRLQLGQNSLARIVCSALAPIFWQGITGRPYDQNSGCSKSFQGRGSYHVERPPSRSSICDICLDFP